MSRLTGKFDPELANELEKFKSIYRCVSKHCVIEDTPLISRRRCFEYFKKPLESLWAIEASVHFRRAVQPAVAAARSTGEETRTHSGRESAPSWIAAAGKPARGSTVHAMQRWKSSWKEGTESDKCCDACMLRSHAVGVHADHGLFRLLASSSCRHPNFRSRPAG